MAGRLFPVCEDCKNLLDREWDNNEEGWVCMGKECEQVLCNTCDQMHFEEHGPEGDGDE